MAKDPAFLFYPGDWQGGTSTFSRFIKGCYLDILIAQFNCGHLSLEEIKTVLGSDFGQAWPTIQKKFEKDSQGLFFNEKLEREMNRRKEYSLSRAVNRKGKYKTYEKDMLNICNSYEKHMETGNETDTLINKDKGVVGEKGKPEKRFRPPEFPELEDYFFELESNVEEAQRFMDYYTSNGWKVGKNPMKDWKAAVRNWIKNKKSFNNGNSNSETGGRKIGRVSVDQLQKFIDMPFIPVSD